MQIWPAIDLRGGNCVRLRQGDYNEETVFSDDPVEVAQRWVAQGADGIHLVDLDGARSGELTNLEVVRRIRAAVSVPCQLGGGIRDEAALARLADLGIDRLIIGTRALREPAWLQTMAQRYPQQIILGIDARDGMVATEGWLETSSVSALELVQHFQASPLAAVVYTDIARDGMMAGPNFESIAQMRETVDLPVIASGGVTRLEDVIQLRATGVEGCIIGRALYEGTIDLKEACREPSR